MTHTEPAPRADQLSPLQRVAVIDDVYAGPRVNDVQTSLGEFCAAVAADDALMERLRTLTGCPFADPEAVTDEAVRRLHESRSSLTAPPNPSESGDGGAEHDLGAITAISDNLARLYLDFEQRYAEVEQIWGQLKRRGYDVVKFHSIEKLFDGAPFQLVLLDLVLTKGEGESEEIAKQVYTNFRSFIILMSNKPGAASQEEDFRRKSRLLRGFFQFCDKAELLDEVQFNCRLDALPKNHGVCHAVHNFVDAIDQALGGPIPEPNAAQGQGDQGGQPLSAFMHTLRTLGLQDYAVLCETTLRDEGQPLGDYVMRLLGFHLIAKLLADPQVRTSVSTLDKMRFTEFLPFGKETSASFKELYADSLTERIAEPWSTHPWQAPLLGTQATEESEAEGPEGAGEDETAETEEEGDAPGAVTTVERQESEIVKTLGFTDFGKDIPFLQLGDLLIRNEASHVYAVLSASCDLQFTPEIVSKERLRERDDTVLLLPGSLRKMGAPPLPKTRGTTGLVRWDGTWYSVDWFPRKLLAVPHCVLRSLFEEKGFTHDRRLQMGRALELQQSVLSWVSRIGLDVQPPLPVDLDVEVFGKKIEGDFVRLGERVQKAAMIFHLRERVQPVLILRQSAFYDILSRFKGHLEALKSRGSGGPSAGGVLQKMTAAITTFSGKMVGMRVPISVPKEGEVKPVRIVDGRKEQSIAQIGFRVGRPKDANAGKDIMFYLSAEFA